MRSLGTRTAEWWWFLEQGRCSQQVGVVLWSYYTYTRPLCSHAVFISHVVLTSRYWPVRHGRERTPTAGRWRSQSFLEPQEENRCISRHILRHRAGQTWREERIRRPFLKLQLQSSQSFKCLNCWLYYCWSIVFFLQCPKPVVVAVHGACIGGGKISSSSSSSFP